MTGIDKKAVRQSFSHAALAYTDAAVMQHQIALRLVALTRSQVAETNRITRILDLGCGSQIFAQHIINNQIRHIIGIDLAEPMLLKATNNHKHNQSIDFVCGDCEALPFADNRFDLIYSSSALHWCDNIQKALHECRRILRNAGLLLIAVYGPDTLHELRNSWSEIDTASHTLDFPNLETWENSLRKAGFSIQISHCQMEVTLYDSVRQLTAHLKHIGVKNLRQDRPHGLITPRQLQTMQTRYYERYNINGKIPASYEVLFLAAKAK